MAGHHCYGQMKDMFQNVNPGLARRFAIENTFSFEDFTESQLRDILDFKLKDQDPGAADLAKQVASDLLCFHGVAFHYAEDDGKAQPISLPKPVHSYPPKLPTSRTPKNRFAFFRRRPANKSDQGVETRDGKPGTKSDVSLCPIGKQSSCLCHLPDDFEEPKRLSAVAETSTAEKSEERAAVALK